MRLLSIVVLAAGCIPVEYPGEPVGSFDVVGALVENACGDSAVPALDPLRFAVELRTDEDGLAFWRRPDSPLVDGTVDQDGNFRFRTRVIVPALAPDPDFDYPGCVLDQREEVEARVVEVEDDDMEDDDMELDEMELEGGNSITLSPSAGSDCTPLLAARGGPFLALPCEVDYQLAGSSREPFE
jgi:hypothetical protein